SALSRYLVARELVQTAREQGCASVAHSSATKGNDQLRLEAALAALAPDFEVVAPLRLWNLRTPQDPRTSPHPPPPPLAPPAARRAPIGRNARGSSAFLADLRDPWQAPPPEVFTLTRPPEGAPDRPVEVAVAFEEGVPRRLDDRPLELAPLVRELNDLAG